MNESEQNAGTPEKASSLHEVGRRAYEPDAEAARLAPACVCNVASRVLWLREKLHEFDAATQSKLKPFVSPLPFETELLSGRMVAVDAAIKKIGEQELAGSPTAAISDGANVE